MSAALAAIIAHVAFWLLLAYGWLVDEISPAGAAVFLALWAGGFFGLPLLPPGAALLAPYVAVLDIVLVFRIFGGDVRLT